MLLLLLLQLLGTKVYLQANASSVHCNTIELTAKLVQQAKHLTFCENAIAYGMSAC